MQVWQGRTKYHLGTARVNAECVLVLLVTWGHVQELTRKVSLSHGRSKMEVQIDMRGSGTGLFWLGHDQQEKCGAG